MQKWNIIKWIEPTQHNIDTKNQNRYYNRDIKANIPSLLAALYQVEAELDGEGDANETMNARESEKW